MAPVPERQLRCTEPLSETFQLHRLAACTAVLPQLRLLHMELLLLMILLRRHRTELQRHLTVLLLWHLLLQLKVMVDHMMGQLCRLLWIPPMARTLLQRMLLLLLLTVGRMVVVLPWPLLALHRTERRLLMNCPLILLQLTGKPMVQRLPPLVPTTLALPTVLPTVGLLREQLPPPSMILRTVLPTVGLRWHQLARRSLMAPTLHRPTLPQLQITSRPTVLAPLRTVRLPRMNHTVLRPTEHPMVPPLWPRLPLPNTEPITLLPQYSQLPLSLLMMHPMVLHL